MRGDERIPNAIENNCVCPLLLLWLLIDYNNGSFCLYNKLQNGKDAPQWWLG